MHVEHTNRALWPSCNSERVLVSARFRLVRGSHGAFTSLGRIWEASKEIALTTAETSSVGTNLLT